MLSPVDIHKKLPQIQFKHKRGGSGGVIRTKNSSFYIILVIFQTSGLKAIGGGSRVKIRIFSGFDINCSKFYVLSCAFDGISKFRPVFSKMAGIWGVVGSGELIFQLLEKI